MSLSLHSMRLRLFTPTTVSSILFLILFPVLCHAQGQEVISIPSVSASPSAQWGVKTNMAYNAISFVNLGFDVGFGKHWGFEAELTTPWWDAPDHHKTAKMLNLGLEGRYYWRGWQDGKTLLAGPYCGLHANGGIYDIVYKNNGVRGDYFAMAGAVVGYTLPIEKAWRLNFAVGLGGMFTDYEHYHVYHHARYGDLLVNHYSGKYTYFGPTKVELSVVWLISENLKK